MEAVLWYVLTSTRGGASRIRILETLDDPLTENATLVPMAHRDTGGDEAYTFEESGGSADGPYVGNGGGAVVATGMATYKADDMGGDEQMTESTTESMTGMDDGTATPTSGGSGPGFTVVAALLAVVAAALLAARNRR